jgi:predicted DNA-binding transcriptional regulator AlpA
VAPVTSDRLSVSSAAKRANIATDTFRKYVRNNQAPQPDGIDETFGRRYWLVSTIDEWMNNRPGRGARRDLHR